MNGLSEFKKMVECQAAELEAKRCGQELLSGYKKILLEGIDKLEKMRVHPSPYAEEVYRIALNDVRYLIGVGKKWGAYKKEKKMDTIERGRN